MRREAFEVPVQTAQQAEYVAALRSLTSDFTSMPQVPPQSFEIE